MKKMAPKRVLFGNGVVGVKWSPRLSCSGFQNLPRQFRRVLTSKECNRCNILPVGASGWGLIKNLLNISTGGNAVENLHNFPECCSVKQKKKRASVSSPNQTAIARSVEELRRKKTRKPQD